MRPFELLTEKDKEIIYEWCTSYGGAEPQDIEQTLKEWDKSKRTLLKALGGKLRVEIPIHTEMEKLYFYKKLEQVYKPFTVSTKEYLKTWLNDSFRTEKTHKFIDTFGYELSLIDGVSDTDISYISSYLSYTSVREGKIISADHEFHGGRKESLRIQSGTKTMRAIRRVLEYYDLQNSLALFPKWRDDISLANTDKVIDGTLVLSIHPLDFMTMSDNNSCWSSCMSWKTNGAYSGGVIEMMNSNLALVAYLKNDDKPFYFNGNEIPNKFWRTLIFAHKKLLLVGKNYPYRSECMEKIVLDKMQELLYNNLKWKYQYKNQRYHELFNYHGKNEYIRDNLGRGFLQHKIFVYMNMAMYNDFIEDVYTPYLCCRNYVDKTLYLNLCGKLTCLCCGKPIYDKDDFYYSDVECNRKYCGDCEEKYRCNCCDIISKSNEGLLYNAAVVDTYGIYDRRICKMCLKTNYLYDKVRNVFIERGHQEYLINKNLHKVFIVENEDELSKIYKIISDGSPNYYYYTPSCVDYESLSLNYNVKFEDCVFFNYCASEFNFIHIKKGSSYYSPKIYYIFNKDYDKIKEAKSVYLAPVTSDWFYRSNQH